MNHTPTILIIDAQKDFTDPHGAYAKRHPIQRIASARKRIETLLPRCHSFLRIQILSHYLPEQFEPGLNLCIEGTAGAEPSLDSSLFSHQIYKTDHDAWTSSRLPEQIGTNPGPIYVAGFLAEYCVLETCQSMHGAGLAPILIKDCIETGDDVQNRKEAMFATLCDLPVIHCADVARTAG